MYAVFQGHMVIKFLNENNFTVAQAMYMRSFWHTNMGKIIRIILYCWTNYTVWVIMGCKDYSISCHSSYYEVRKHTLVYDLHSFLSHTFNWPAEPPLNISFTESVVELDNSGLNQAVYNVCIHSESAIVINSYLHITPVRVQI